MALNGGKTYLAQRIIALMPPRCQNSNAPDGNDPGWLHFVEPYAGGLAVLLALNPEGISEVVNDKNRELTNFWACLQNERTFAEFQRQAQAIPFSMGEYRDACRDMTLGDIADGYGEFSVVRAVRFFVRCRQSMSGRMKTFTPLTKARTRRGMNEQASAWLSCVDGLPAVHERLRRVVVLDSMDALDVIRQQDGPRTMFYLDPPYLHETRTGYAPSDYECEMTDEEHVELLSTLAECKGKWMLSGYPSRLYDDFFKDFPHTLHTFDLPNHAAKSDDKRRMTECLWTNF